MRHSGLLNPAIIRSIGEMSKESPGFLGLRFTRGGEIRKISNGLTRLITLPKSVARFGLDLISFRLSFFFVSYTHPDFGKKVDALGRVPSFVR